MMISMFVVASFVAIGATVYALNDSPQQLSLANAPLLKIHVKFNRPSLQFHGQSSFHVFATPVVSVNKSHVIYDGYATFGQDDGTTYTYSYVHGAGYLTTKTGDSSTIECSKSSMLPFDDILPALNRMTLVASASIGDEAVECPSGNLFKTTFGDVRFITCAAGPSGFVAYSKDVTIQVTYLSKPIRIHVSSLRPCKAVATAVPITPIALSLLTGNAVPASITRHLKTTEQTCACKSKPRPCVFFHGIGVKHDMDELQDTPKEAGNRMGNMNKHAPCCSEVKYAVLNTLDYTWMSDALQHKFCDRALSLSETSDKTQGVIKDTVVVTHSMGGLVMSMALATGKCSFGEGTSWVAISTPMMGTMVSTVAQRYCNNEVNAISTNLLELIDQCPMPIARQFLVYENDTGTPQKLKDAYKTAQKAYAENVDAAMCGDDPGGVFSQYTIVMKVSATVNKFPHNDGLVEFRSCAIGLDESQFGTSYTSKFYKAALNHADTAFLTYDSMFKDSQKPMKWFECLL